MSPKFVKSHGVEVKEGASIAASGACGGKTVSNKWATVDVVAGEFEMVVEVPVLDIPGQYDLFIGNDLLEAHHFQADFASGLVLAQGCVVRPKTGKMEPAAVAAEPAPSESVVEEVENPLRPPDRGSLVSEKGESPSRPPDRGPKTSGVKRPSGRQEKAGLAQERRSRSGRLVQAPKALQDCEVTINGVTCVTMTYEEMEDGLAKGDLEVVVRVDPLSDTAQACATQGGTASAEEEEIEKLTKEIMSEFSDVFSSELKRLPPLRDQNFSVELTDTKPLPHRAPYAMTAEGRKGLIAIVDDMLKTGLIRRHDGPASCPIFLVKKKSLPGQPTRWRAVLDARPRNAQTAPRPFNAPRQDDVLPKLARKRYLSQIDATSAFYQVRIEPDQEELFTFADPRGQRYALRVMCMGATNAMAVLHDVVCTTFPDFIRDDELAAYADDWVLGSDTLEEHVDLLRRFLRRCREASFVLHPEKSMLFTRKVTFLGFDIDSGLVTPSADKVEAFQTWPVPETVRDVRAFLGAANYLAHMIPHFRAIAAPLDRITGIVKGSDGKKLRDPPLRWNSDLQQSFKAICDALSSAPVLALPDLSNPHFAVRTDASLHGLGGMVEQRQPDGTMHPVGYFSRKTTDAEKTFDIRTLELLAVVCTLDKYESWLAGALIDVYTDHQSLIYLATSCAVTGRLVRCLDTLQQHRLRWHYVPGSENDMADALSRRADYAEDEQPIRQELFQRYMRTAMKQASGAADGVTPGDLQGGGSSYEEPEKTGRSAGAYPITMLASVRTQVAADCGIPTRDKVHLDTRAGTRLIPDADWVKVFTEGYAADTYFAPIWKAVQDNQPSTSLDAHDRFYEAGGLLFRYHPIYKAQLCVPEGQALNNVLGAAHDDNGHMGVQKTVSAMRKMFFPRLKAHVQKYIRGCVACNRAKSTTQKVQGELMPLPIPSRPWTDISLDIVSGLKEVYGKNAILTVVDRRSKTVRAIPMATRDGESNTEAIVDALIEHIYQYTGPFFNILSDRGPQFNSALYKEIMARFGVSISLTTAYHPETDGQTERYNRVLAESLRASLNNSGDYHWPDILPFVVWSINSTVHQALGMSPFEADYARTPHQWWDVLLPGVTEERETLPSEDRDLREATDRMVQQGIEEGNAKMKVIADAKKRPAPAYKTGDRVFVSAHALRSREENEMLGTTSKLRSRFIGPFCITGRISQNVYKIELPPAMRRAHNSINVAYMRKAAELGTYGREDEPTPVMMGEQGEFYQPEALLSHRHSRLGYDYLVSWVGYGTERNSWISVDNLALCRDMVQRYWHAMDQAAPAGALPRDE